MPNQITKTGAYDDAIYNTRYKVEIAASAAGANGTFGQYRALGNETLWSAGAWQVLAGTSTVTSTTTQLGSTGLITTVVNTNTAATAITAYRVSGTSTTTFQPFVIANQNGTLGAMAYQNFTALTAPGTYGGIQLLAGDLLYMVNGTDATATSFPIWEFSYSPLGAIVA